MNADVLVDRVHKYYWCKVSHEIQINQKLYLNFSGAQSCIHLLDLPPALRSAICRRETQDRATTHLSQVPFYPHIWDNLHMQVDNVVTDQAKLVLASIMNIDTMAVPKFALHCI